MKTTNLLWMLAAGSLICASGCGLQKNPRATVLRTEDFIADPTTTPTERTGIHARAAEGPAGALAADVEAAEVPTFTELPAPPAPAQPAEASVASLSPPAEASPPQAAGRSIGASDDSFDLTAQPGEPVIGAEPGPAAGAPVLVDAKVGEINGRPVRVQEMFDELGNRLRAAAQNRVLTEDDWRGVMGRSGNPPAPISRGEWIQFANRLFIGQLEEMLQDELLAAEARAALRPEQQAGLRAWVNELAQQERRRVGGEQAELTRSLQGRNMTEQQFRRRGEEKLLIGYQVEEQIRKRVRVSWRDVRLWYERNYDLFNPPPTASFRWIQVPPDRPEEIEAVQKALDDGVPFEEVARRPENRFSPGNGGFADERTFTGPYSEATFYAEPLNALAQGLALPPDSESPGGWAGPVDFGGMKTWISLDRLVQVSRPLSDRDVQLNIARVLYGMGVETERDRYITRLKQRASFNDLEVMADMLTQLAVERYWPAASRD